MKKYLFISLLSVIAIGASAQLSSPVQTGPLDGDSGVFVNERLTWNASVGGLVTGYDCELDVDSTFSNPVALPIYGAGATTNLLDYNQVYYWRVRAKNGSTTGPWSDTWSYTTFNDEFTGTFPKTANQNPEVKLQWDTISGSDSYTIELSTNPSFTSPTVFLVPRPKPDSADGGRARLALANLTFGTTYYWRVRSNHGLDQSSFSAAVSFSVIGTVELRQPADNDTEIYARTNLSAKNTNGVTEYRFQITDDSTFNPSSPYFHTHIAYKKDFPPFFNTAGDLEIPNISVQAEYLSYGTKYFWRVQGVNNTAVSAWSPIRNFTTIDSVVIESPSNKAAGLGAIGVEFKWEKSNGAEGYVMEIDTSANYSNPRFVEIFGDTVNTVVLDVERTSKDYFWRVRAFHFRDSTNWTATRSFYGTPTGIPTATNDYGFSMFPNPATDVVYFDLQSKTEGNALIELYSVLGNKVDEVLSKNVLGNQRIEYNTTELQRGVYMVVINIDDHRETHRLSIK